MSRLDSAVRLHQQTLGTCADRRIQDLPWKCECDAQTAPKHRTVLESALKELSRWVMKLVSGCDWKRPSLHLLVHLSTDVWLLSSLILLTRAYGELSYLPHASYSTVDLWPYLLFSLLPTFTLYQDISGFVSLFLLIILLFKDSILFW